MLHVTFNHAPFRDGLPSVASTCYRQPNLPNLMSLTPLSTNIWKAEQKCRNGVVWDSYDHSRSPEIASTDRGQIILAFHGDYVPILHRFWDIARYWSKVADLNPPYLYLAPPLGVTPSEFSRNFWHQKTRVHGLSYDIVYVILRLAVLVQCRLVTDWRTDRQTDTRRRHIVLLA